jgi:hypothetical protein
LLLDCIEALRDPSRVMLDATPRDARAHAHRCGVDH